MGVQVAFPLPYLIMINYDDIQIQDNTITKVKYIPTSTSKPFNITLDELERQINGMVYYGQNPIYGFNKVYDQKLEHSYIPQFVDGFYNYIYEYGKLPSQKEFWEHYLETNSAFLTQMGESIKVDFMASHFITDRKAYLARVLRTYPSLLRDFHFIVMLKNDDFFKDKFYYSLVNDYNKVDITINYGKPYKIGLDVNTKRCNEFRQLKQNRHEEQDVTYLSIDLSNGKKIGYSNNPLEKFIVYPNDVLRNIRLLLNGQRETL